MSLDNQVSKCLINNCSTLMIRHRYNEMRLTQSEVMVTVVMAAFNAERTIRRALQSVFNQTFSNWELVCVDDGSFDNTKKILHEYSQSEPRLRIHLLDKNVGQALALCQAYKTGVGDYFLQLDADDFVASDCLECLVSEALLSKADAVVSDYMYENPDTREFRPFHDANNVKTGSTLTGREAFALTIPWKISGFCLWSSRVVKLVAVNESKAIENEYVTRELFLASERVVLGSGKYFHAYTPGSASRAQNLSLLRKLNTTEGMYVLATINNLEEDVIRRILDRHRLLIISYTSLLSLVGINAPAGAKRAAKDQIRQSRFAWERNVWLEYQKQRRSRFNFFFHIYRLRLRCLLESCVRPFTRKLKARLKQR